MDSFTLHIMASDHMVYEGDALSVSMMTTEGSVGILAHHANTIMAIVPGTLEYVPAASASTSAGHGGTASASAFTSAGHGGTASASAGHGGAASASAGTIAASGNQSGRQEIVVSDGLLKVENGEVMILVDTAERPEDIDEARARRAAEKAREDLKRTNSNRQAAMVSAELSRAMSRIKASRNKHRL